MALLLVPGLSRPAGAQDRQALLDKGIAAGGLEPRVAADAFEAIVAADSLDAEANWRAALALVNLGKPVPDERKDRMRDSLYRRAEVLAERAVRLAPDDAEAQYALGLALGKSALTRSKKDQVHYAVRIREQALRTLALNPDHDGALHILGRWHAEIQRLSNVEEFFARKFLGAGIFREASWAEAVRHLERAVAVRPDFIYHRIGLAEVLVDVKRFSDARAHLDAVPALPTLDAMDGEYRRQAAALRARIARR